MTDEDKRIDEVREHLQEIGVVCGQWAHLEFLFEVTFWWLVGYQTGRPKAASLHQVCLSKRLPAKSASFNI
jgi:hypothetical protein